MSKSKPADWSGNVSNAFRRAKNMTLTLLPEEQTLLASLAAGGSQSAVVAAAIRLLGERPPREREMRIERANEARAVRRALREVATR